MKEKEGKEEMTRGVHNKRKRVRKKYSTNEIEKKERRMTFVFIRRHSTKGKNHKRRMKK